MPPQLNITRLPKPTVSGKSINAGPSPWVLSLAFPLLMLAFSGCGKKEPQYVEVQEIQQDTPAVQEPAMHSEHDGHDHGSASGPFAFTVPEGWSSKEHSNMVLMAFQVGQPPEVLADLTVSAFPGDVGGQLANINRWRRQVGLGSIDEAGASELIKELQISGLPAWQVSFTGPAGVSTVGEPVRMVVSAVFQDGQTWFFKLMGGQTAVTDEEENYAAFLESVKF